MAEEFRVFLPDLHNQDYWIPQAQQREYWDAIRTVLEVAAAIVEDSDVEKRVDVYSVVNDSVGLKMRGGNKLEMKVRRKVPQIPGAEQWVKYKYRRSDPEADNKIMLTLEQHGITESLPVHFPKGCEQIAISKERSQGTLDHSLAFEYANLSVTAVDSADWPEAASRKWYSISLETGVFATSGLSSIIANKLVSDNPNAPTALVTQLALAVRAAMKIFRGLPSLAAANRFFPIVSGYPAWVARLHDPMANNRAMLRTHMKRLDDFLRFARVETLQESEGIVGSPHRLSEVMLAPEAPMNIFRYGLVVCKNQDSQILMVLETGNRGWWMPGGFVQAGETATQGAFRETLQETGIPVRLMGILQIQEETRGADGKQRYIFFAEPTDDRAPKAFEDEHSIRAEWKTLAELRQLNSQHQLRSPEPLEWAEYLESGGGCASLEFLRCIDDLQLRAPLDLPASQIEHPSTHSSTSGDAGLRSPSLSTISSPPASLSSRRSQKMLPMKSPRGVRNTAETDPETSLLRSFIAVIMLALPAEPAGGVWCSSHGFCCWHGLQACQMDNVDLVRQFIHRDGAPVNFADHTEGWTPLHHAVKNHSVGVVELLLRSEADPTHQSVKGRNCLHFAARHNVPDAIRAVHRLVDLAIIRQLLLQTDDKGRTALDEAVRRHAAECEELLRHLHAQAGV